MWCILLLVYYYAKLNIDAVYGGKSLESWDLLDILFTQEHEKGIKIIQAAGCQICGKRTTFRSVSHCF